MNAAIWHLILKRKWALHRSGWKLRLEETQAGIKIAGRNINNLRHADDTTFIAESEEELKSLLMKVKVGLKAQHSENKDHGIRSHHFVGNRWGNSGNSVPKGNQSWLFIGRTDAEAETPILWPPNEKNWFIGRTAAEAETPILWPPHAKNWLIWKDPDAGKDWRSVF